MQIRTGDSRLLLEDLPSESVRCVISSPPYWSVRSFDGGLGCEPELADYLSNMVGLFRQVRRVLSPDGTMWVNLCDSWWTGERRTLKRNHRQNGVSNPGVYKAPPGVKRKDMIGTPWMLALALRNDGWYLRQEVLWSKGEGSNEEFANDRPSINYERLFLFSKSPAYYFHMPRTKDGKLKSVWTMPKEIVQGVRHHGTFPVQLAERCILLSTQQGDTVLDPFMGTGTVGVGAVRLKRDFIGFEIVDSFVTYAKKRIQTASASLTHELMQKEWNDV